MAKKSTHSAIKDHELLEQLATLQALIRSSGVLASELRKKEIRKNFGHENLANLIGDLQRLLLVPCDLDILDEANRRLQR